MLEPNFTPTLLSAAILKAPLVERGEVSKGVIILNQVDQVVRLLPELRTFFLIIERKGWCGMAHSALADIKLVEDLSTLEASKELFPKAVLLPLSNADFVDTAAFRPLGLAHEYDVIQIACWSKRKRIALLIAAAAKLPHLSFVHLGSFEERGTAEELQHREACIRFAKKVGARMAFPFGDSAGNQDLPWDKGVINRWINKARLGVLTASAEGHNRFKMECIAADRPVLLARDAGMTTQKHINERTGGLFEPTPRELADAIVDTLEHRERFAPREYLLAHAGRVASVSQLKGALREVCERTGQPYRFDDLDWDGRNECFTWGEPVLTLLTDEIGKYRSMVRNDRPVRFRALASLEVMAPGSDAACLPVKG